MTAVVVPAPLWPRLVAWFRLLLAVATEVDPRVVDRARGGDQRAFGEIVDHYDDRLRALAFRLLGDRARMDDALQEAYVKAFVGLPKFKGSAGLGTWLFRITYNACMDELRRGRRVVTLFDQDDAETPSGDRGPDDIAVDRRDLAAALDELPPDHRAAVMLVDAYGLDYREAGEVLGVAEGTVASRLSRARATLRRALGGVQ